MRTPNCPLGEDAKEGFGQEKDSRSSNFKFRFKEPHLRRNDPKLGRDLPPARQFAFPKATTPPRFLGEHKHMQRQVLMATLLSHQAAY